MPLEALQKRPRKASKEVRRRQLIDAAIATIAECGLSGATTARVTEAAGLSLGIVSLHFESKDNLLTESLRFLATELREAWRGGATDANHDAAERLSAIIDALFAPEVCTPDKVAVWFAFFGEAKHRVAYRKILDHFDRERVDAIEAQCAALKAAGGYDAVDATALATQVESLTDGLWLSMLLYPDWMTPERAKAQVYDLLAVHFPDHFDRAPTGTADDCAKDQSLRA